MDAICRTPYPESATLTLAHAPTPSDPPAARLDYWLALPLLALIRLYQRTLSRLLPPACRFEPTCSHYAAHAFQQHRVPRALVLTAWRLLRCQPMCVGGHDPVPPGPWNGRWRAAAPVAISTSSPCETQQ